MSISSKVRIGAAVAAVSVAAGAGIAAATTSRSNLDPLGPASLYVPLEPQRTYDGIVGDEFTGGAVVLPFGHVDDDCVTAVEVNVTLTRTTERSFASLWDPDLPVPPETSTVNVDAGNVSANQVTVGTAIRSFGGHSVALYVSRSGRLVIDTVGVWIASGCDG